MGEGSRDCYPDLLVQAEHDPSQRCCRIAKICSARIGADPFAGVREPLKTGLRLHFLRDVLNDTKLALTRTKLALTGT